MAHYEWDEFGQRFHIDDEGNETIAPEIEGDFEAAMIAAGKQMTDIGRGVRSFFGEDVSAEAAEAERLYQNVGEEYPVAEFVGNMLPSLAAAPIGAGGVAANMALQAGVGAVEGYLDYDPRATGGQRAIAGAAGGVLGDVGGRMVGRVFNTAKGLAGDLLLPRRRATNEAAQVFEDMGGETLAYQRLEPGTRPAGMAERAAQGAQASINPPSIIRETMEANDKLFRDTASEAVGLPGDAFDNLGPDWKNAALDRFNSEYANIEQIARGAGELKLSEKLTGRLMRNKQVKAAIEEDDIFAILKDGKLLPGEYLEARDALSDHINTLYNQGAPSRAIRGEKLLKELDDEIAGKLPDDFKDGFARLREQYRVFSIMEKPNVIDNTGQINVRKFRNDLDSKTSGFGRTATAGGETTNRETRGLIDLMQAADRPEFKAFRSSGTAENLALGEAMDDAVGAASGLYTGDARPALGFGAKLMAPGVVGASQAGGGRAFEGAFTRAPIPFARGGSTAGRSYLDESFYPFVGADDERQP